MLGSQQRLGRNRRGRLFRAGVGGAFSDGRILGQARHDIRRSRDSIDHLSALDRREMNLRQGMVIATVKRRGQVWMESSGFGKILIERHISRKERKREKKRRRYVKLYMNKERGRKKMKEDARVKEIRSGGVAVIEEWCGRSKPMKHDVVSPTRRQRTKRKPN